RSISEDLAGDYPQYSLETAVAKRPEVIFNQTGEAGLPERLKETPAGRSSRVFHIDDDLLLRPGPRLVDGLEQMAWKLHPEVFGSVVIRGASCQLALSSWQPCRLRQPMRKLPACATRS
ncbi:MAG TPA: hypothetical protein VNS63_17365, partial [Blastocatellia bacterium]|nr:hypothetical protein [Blastocatellia bacterium]